MNRWLLLVTLAGCGRLDFEARTDARGPGGDVASDIADGNVAPFCSLHAQATFCDDFESASLARWDGTMLDKGTAVVSAAAAREGTGGLLVTMGSIPSGQSGSAFVYRVLGPPDAAAATLSFDVQTAGGDADAYPVFAAIGFNDATTNHRVEYVYSLPPRMGNIEEVVDPGSGPTYSYYNFTSPAPNAWHRVQIATTTTHIDVTVDGATSLSMNLAGNTGGQAYIQFGVPYVSGPLAAWSAWFDNVLVD